jgi:hypothetical protein
MKKKRGEVDALAENLEEVRRRSKSVLNLLRHLPDHRIPLNLSLLRLPVQPLLVTQVSLHLLLLSRNTETLLVSDLVKLHLFIVRLAVVVSLIGRDVLLCANFAVSLSSARLSANDDTSAEALDEVRELPGLLFDLFGARTVLDRVVDAGDEGLVAFLVGRVGGGGRNAGRRRNGREENFARSGVGSERDLEDVESRKGAADVSGEERETKKREKTTHEYADESRDDETEDGSDEVAL